MGVKYKEFKTEPLFKDTRFKDEVFIACDTDDVVTKLRVRRVKKKSKARGGPAKWTRDAINEMELFSFMAE